MLQSQHLFPPAPKDQAFRELEEREGKKQAHPPPIFCFPSIFQFFFICLKYENNIHFFLSPELKSWCTGPSYLQLPSTPSRHPLLPYILIPLYAFWFSLVSTMSFTFCLLMLWHWGTCWPWRDWPSQVSQFLEIANNSPSSTLFKYQPTQSPHPTTNFTGLWYWGHYPLS